MDIGKAFSEAVMFTRETLVGKPLRWLILLLLNLPWIILLLFVNSLGGADHAQVNENTAYLGLIIVLGIAGLVLSFFSMGYIVRILRSGSMPPEFDSWGELALDGIRMDILLLIWMLPIIIITIVFFSLTIFFIKPTGTGLGLLPVLIVPLMLFELVYYVVMLIFGPVAAVRFARSGSIRQGLAISEIGSTIGRIRWGKYLIALIILAVFYVIFIAIGAIIYLLFPIAGIIGLYLIQPAIMVFLARFLCDIYGYDESREIPNEVIMRTF